MDEWIDAVSSPTVIAIDPGGTTGWSIMVVHPEALVDPQVKILANILHWSNGQIKCGDDDGERKCAYDLATMIDRWQGSCLLIEDFILRRNSKGREMLSPVRITAMLEYAVSGFVTMYRQQPSMAMTTATDDRLKRWNLYNRAGGMEHARDADRHAITWLRRCKTDAQLRGRCWPHLYSLSGKLRSR